LIYRNLLYCHCFFRRSVTPGLANLRKLRDAKWEVKNRNNFADIAKIIGKDVARVYADRHALQDKTRRLDDQISQMDEYLQQMRDAIQDGLGLPKKKWLGLEIVINRWE
jgi:hypothetical protein